jgi:hypothetical protein
MKNAYKSLVGNPWENGAYIEYNIKVYFKEKGCEVGGLDSTSSGPVE